MKKIISSALILLFLCCLMTGCGHQHSCQHEWAVSTCLEIPKCKLCHIEQPDGEPYPHYFFDASCTSPKTCVRCGLTEGEKVEHVYIDATCTKAKTCKVCGVKEGEALGHDFVAETCTSALRCSRCKAKGDVPGHQYEQNACVVCGEAMIGNYDDLVKYLNQNYAVLQTAVGKVENISYSVLDHKSSVMQKCDFELRIHSGLYCREQSSSMSYIIGTKNAFSYEERLQAFADILSFELAIAEFTQEIFPGKKFSVSFYESGYTGDILPTYSLNVYLPFFNYRFNGSGLTGYAGTELCDWYMDEGRGTGTKPFISCSMRTTLKPCGLHDDVIAKTGYNLQFTGYLYD